MSYIEWLKKQASMRQDYRKRQINVLLWVLIKRRNLRGFADGAIIVRVFNMLGYTEFFEPIMTTNIAIVNRKQCYVSEDIDNRDLSYEDTAWMYTETYFVVPTRDWWSYRTSTVLYKPFRCTVCRYKCGVKCRYCDILCRNVPDQCEHYEVCFDQRRCRVVEEEVREARQEASLEIAEAKRRRKRQTRQKRIKPQHKRERKAKDRVMRWEDVSF